MREDVERTLARRLVAEQGSAVERALDNKADLAGMRGLASLDRLLDTVEHIGREYDLRPPVVLDQMPGDSPDAHDLPAPRGAATTETAATAAEAAAVARRGAAAPAASRRGAARP